MINTAQCPSCRETVQNIVVEDMPMLCDGIRWKGFSYSCPACKTILGVQMNPRALNNELEDKVVTKLKKGK